MSPLYDEMTRKEVIDEFARTLVTIIRRKIAQEEREKKTIKSKSKRTNKNISADERSEK